MIAASRKHMAEMLQDRMIRSKALDSDRGGADSNHVKTYLVEASIPENTKPMAAGKFVESILSQTDEAGASGTKIQKARGDTLISMQVLLDNETTYLYVDYTNPRFWQIHSTGSSEALDHLVTGWTTNLAELDRAWLPQGFLQNCTIFGAMRGAGVHFDNGWLFNEDESYSRLKMIKMQLRGHDAARLLKIVKKPDAAPHETPLSRITIKMDGGQCVNDIKFDGKITARGKSFSDHLSLTVNLYNRYARNIRDLESKYAIQGRCRQRFLTISGEPIGFRFSQEIQDLQRFCEQMFSGGAPFRLWGFPARAGDDYYNVHAVDLHSGKTLAFEISPKLIRVYLPAGTCGNAIFRFYANIQQRLDAEVEAVTGSGESILAF